MILNEKTAQFHDTSEGQGETSSGYGGDGASALLGGLDFFLISVARGKRRISLQQIQEIAAAVSLQHTARYFRDVSSTNTLFLYLSRFFRCLYFT